MRNYIFILSAWLMVPVVSNAQTSNASWNFKEALLPVVVKAVPAILAGQNPTNGQFGKGLWIANDQTVIYPLAAAWAINSPSNSWYHNAELLKAIIRGGDALIAEQGKDGRWMFRKKDGSTWGLHYDTWVYSRWARAYSLISSNMPADDRERWRKALELGYSGIARRELGTVHNIPAHHAMGLFVAGGALNHPEWQAQAAAFLQKVAQAQDTNGFWSEHAGPVVNYNFVYSDALGTYYGLSHDPKVLPALERCARFHANFTYPDGSNIETVDERNPYLKGHRPPGIGFSFSPEGRGYLRQRWSLVTPGIGDADTIASLLLYGEEGGATPAPGERGDSVFVTADGRASVVRQGPWCASLSAYCAEIYKKRWIQDRQNFVSLFHAGTGLILGGGNTKLQPLWSSFTVGDPRLLKHRAGDENPDFSEPAGLLHVPSQVTLALGGQALALDYGLAHCGIRVDLSETNRARLVYSAENGGAMGPVQAHVTLLPSLGKAWRTAAGKSGTLGAKPVMLNPQDIGGWFEHDGWRVELPAEATISWPVLPHDPYRKDGRAEPGQGRIVATLPFSDSVKSQAVTVVVK
jgi:hypothetical protein